MDHKHCEYKKYTKQNVIDFVINYVQENGICPTLLQFPNRRLIYRCYKEFGGIRQLIQELHINAAALKRCKAQEEVIQDIKLKLTGKCLSFELYQSLGGSESKVVRAFGSWRNAITVAFSPKKIKQWDKIKHHKRQYTKEDYLQDYIETSLRYGNNTKFAYKKYGKYNTLYETEFFGGHALLVEEAKKRSTKFYDRFCVSKKLPVPVSEPQYKKRNSIVEPYPLIKLIEQMEQYYLTHDRYIKYESYYKDTGLPEDVFKTYGGLKQFQQLTRIPELEKTRILERFYKEKAAIIEKYGRFSMKLYKKEPGTLHHLMLVKYFGSLLEFRKVAGLEITEECISNRTKAYTDQEYSNFLWKIYNKYGFISVSLIDNEPNHIARECIVKHFGTVEAACKHFDIPYKTPAHRSKFYTEIEAKACNYLQTPCIQEKTWPWLKYKNRLRCDLFFPLLNLVIEVDGPQHYKNYRFFHESDEKYYTALKRDQIKNEELPKHGIDLVRINSDNVKQIKTILRPYKRKLELIYKLCAF